MADLPGDAVCSVAAASNRRLIGIGSFYSILVFRNLSPWTGEDARRSISLLLHGSIPQPRYLFRRAAHLRK
jgi:hypothetical protein